MRYLPHTLGIVGGVALGFAVSVSLPAKASRNSVGTYTLPSGNPVTPGTTISSVWANSTLGDIATEITNSLDRSGRGGMLAPLRLQQGTALNPGLTFNGELNTGLYLAGTNDVRMQVSGTESFRFTPSGTITPGTAEVGELQVNGESGFGGFATFASDVIMDATLKVTGASTFNGASSFVAPITLNSGGPSLVLKPGGADHVYTEYYADTAAPGTRSGFTGYGSAGVSDFAISNSMTGGNILLSTPGQVVANAAVRLTGANPSTTAAHTNTVTPRNIIKAWGRIKVAGLGSTSATVEDGFNVASASVLGSVLNVTLASAMTGTTYALVVTSESNGYNCSGFPLTSTTFQISCRDISGSTLPFPAYNFQSGATSSAFNFVALGAQ